MPSPLQTRQGDLSATGKGVGGNSESEESHSIEFEEVYVLCG